MARLAPEGKLLVSLEEFEKFYLTKIENILRDGPDDADEELIDVLCTGVCLIKQGISQSQDRADSELVLMFDQGTRRIVVCRK